MAILPRYTAQQGLDSGRGSLPNDFGERSGAAIGQAVRNVGESMVNLGVVYKNQRDKTEEFDTERRFLEFQGNQNRIYQTAATNDMPANGLGFYDARNVDITQQGTNFLATVPERLRPQYQTKMQAYQENYRNHAATAENTTRQNYFRTEIGNTLNGWQSEIYTNPSALEDNLARGYEFIDKSGLPDAEKQQLKKKWETAGTLAYYQGLIKVDPDRAAQELAAPKPEGPAALVPPQLRSTLLEASRATGVSPNFLGIMLQKDSQQNVTGAKTALPANRYFTDQNFQSKNYTKEELAPVDGVPLKIDVAAVAAIDRATEIFGRKIPIMSAQRSEQMNTALTTDAPHGNVGLDKQHVDGTGFKINTAGMSESEKQKLLNSLIDAGFNTYGFYAGAPDTLHVGLSKKPLAVYIGNTDGKRAPDWASEILDVRHGATERQEVTRNTELPVPNPIAQPAKSRFFGDSLSRGMAQVAGVMPDGQNGATIAGTLKQLQAGNLRPGETIRLSIGTNDAADSNLPIDKIRQDAAAIVALAKEKGVSIIWYGPPGNVKAGWDARAAQINEVLKKDLAEQGVTYIDTRALNLQDRANDGTHLTPRGYKQMLDGANRSNEPIKTPFIQAPNGRVLTTANTELPAHNRAILDTIAGTESPGYDIMYGGVRFNNGFKDHPRQSHLITSGPNAGKYTTAAGRYQFLTTTWDATVKAYNEQNPNDKITDFSPENQDKAALFLAQQTYKRMTQGRNLEDDLRSGDPRVIGNVGYMLRGEWTSLPGGIEAGTNQNRFVAAYSENLNRYGDRDLLPNKVKIDLNAPQTPGNAIQFRADAWSNDQGTGMLDKYAVKYGVNIQGMTKEQKLNLRNNVQLSIVMASEYAKENAAALRQSLGREPNNAELYMAHHFDVATAVKLINAARTNPNLALSEVIPEWNADDAKMFNKFNGPNQGPPRTVGEAVSFLSRRFTSEPIVNTADAQTPGSVGVIPNNNTPVVNRPNVRVASLSVDQLIQLQNQSLTAINERTTQLEAQEVKANAIKTQSYTALIGNLERQIYENPGFTKADLQAQGVTDADYVKLAKKIDERDQQQQVLGETLTRFNSHGVFSPYNNDDRKGVDMMYQGFDQGGNKLRGKDNDTVLALGEIVRRTGIVPKSAAGILTGFAMSQNVNDAVFGLTSLQRIIGDRINALEGGEGNEAIKRDLATFRYYTEDLGLTAQDAAAKIVERRDPANAKEVNANRKTAQEFVKGLTPSDLKSAFNVGIPWWDQPNVGFNEVQKEAMMQKYRDVAEQAFMDFGGDKVAAKAHAIQVMRFTFGGSKITGREVLMMYPPDKFYPPLNGGHEYILEQIQNHIKANGHLKVKPEDIIIGAIPQTAEDIRLGQPPRYEVRYMTRQNGFPQMHVLPGAFIPDVAQARQLLSEQRHKKFVDLQAVRQLENEIAPYQNMLPTHQQMVKSVRKPERVVEEDFNPDVTNDPGMGGAW